jgi:hypothetical protein
MAHGQGTCVSQTRRYVERSTPSLTTALAIASESL